MKTTSLSGHHSRFGNTGSSHRNLISREVDRECDCRDQCDEVGVRGRDWESCGRHGGAVRWRDSAAAGDVGYMKNDRYCTRDDGFLVLKNDEFVLKMMNFAA